MTFQMDHRLSDSSFFVADWDLCRVSLKNDSTYPWLYLVPRRDGIREMYELSTADQNQLIKEIGRAGKALSQIYNADKINTAALGNMVPQLHVHVFARFKTDISWPKPVWVVQADEIPYTDATKNAEIQKLNGFFAAFTE